MNIKEIINEAVYQLNDDVDKIYNIAFKDTIDAINNNTWDGFFKDKMFGSTSFLSSKECKKADKLNPMNVFAKQLGNYYNPSEGSISFSMNSQALSHLTNYLHHDNPLEAASAVLQESDREQFKLEFTEERLKGSIHHELSHWLDDTLHNNHIRNRVERANEFPNRQKASSIFNQGEQDVNMSKFEVNAQVHSLIQIKRSNEDAWDSFSFQDAINKNSTLSHLSKTFKNKGLYSKWKRYLLKRLDRENMLGKKMHLS